jgi:exodeoxyribonuclease VII large subunit
MATRPVMVQPERMLDTATQRIDDADRKLNDAIAKTMDHRQHAFEKIANRLDAMSPLKTLARGYSVTTDQATGALLTHVDEARAGQAIVTRVADGILKSQITEVIPNP